MANYYVSASRGNDTTGTGTATNPWKTIGKAAGPTPAITLTSASVIYVEPGVYYEGFTLALAPTSTNTLRIVGDCDGAGFAAGGYATPSTGPVTWAAWSDDANVLSVPCLSASSKSYVTLERIKFLGGMGTGTYKGSCVSVVGGTGWAIRDCLLLATERTGNSNSALSITGATGGGAMDHVVERCDLTSASPYQSTCLDLAIYEQAGEYDANVAVRNCRMVPTCGNQGIGVVVRIAGGSGGKLARGFLVEHCTVFGNGYGIRVYPGVTGKSLATPNVVRGCLIQGTGTGLEAGDSTHVAEDYNVLNSATPRTLVSVGAHSYVNVRPAIDLDDGRAFGTTRRPTLTPDDLSIYKVPAGSYTPPTLDRFGRTRNADTAIGALEIGYDAATGGFATLLNAGLIR